MIHKHYKDGQLLDVAGLNKIVVLIDRSETEITEIGFNEWSPKLNGPPHKHNDKDQVFYIMSGSGKVRLGEKIFNVKEGNCVYVPHGLVHQTITPEGKPLQYLLLNIFNSRHYKEGHETFAEHIEKVKQIRKEQAESGLANVIDDELENFHSKPAKFIENIDNEKKYEFGSSSVRFLLERHETNGFELMLVNLQEHIKGVLVTDSEKEQAFFIIKGSGKITINNEEEIIKPGEIIFIPRNSVHASEAFEEGLTYLCLNSYIDQPKDANLEQKYNLKS